MKNKATNEKFKTMIGGQALIEGIMMLGPDKSAVVVRTKNGIESKVTSLKKSEGFSVKKLPLIRGVFNFCKSMKVGVQALMYSADLLPRTTRPKRLQSSRNLTHGLKKALRRKGQGILVTLSVILGICFSVALFFVLPSLLGSVINRWITSNELVRNLLEGLLRILIS